MVDLLSIEANRIRIRDTDGTVTFDTDERPFLPLKQIAGTWSWPTRTVTSTASSVGTLDVDATHALDSCPAICNVVRGAFYASVTSGSAGVVGLGWFNAGGSYVHYNEQSSLAAFSFIASGGLITVNERVYLRAFKPATLSSLTLTMYAGSLQYKLIAGVYL